jgi:hypothetical protein
MSDKPKRKYELEIRMGADSYEDMLNDLIDWAQTMKIESPGIDYSTDGVSAGYHSSHSYKIAVTPDMTHERYFEELDAWLDEQKADKP